VVEDGGQVLAESGAIIEYLAEKYGDGRLVPPVGSPDRLRHRYWLHYAEGSAMPPMLMSLVFSRVRNAPAPFFVNPIARGIADRVMAEFVSPQIRLHLDFMESELGRSTWFAGNEFGAADIQMSFPVEAAAARGGLDGKRPRLMEFLARIHGRPAYQRALEKGGPFSLMR
jgi:glutathione S-transferase